MRKHLLVLGLALVALSGAARAQFCPGVTPWVFNDVPSNDPFCSFITYMATSGITTGCQVIDANNRLYCPEGTVSRKQMAAYLVRLRDNLFPLTCAAGQIMKFNGASWACANDETATGGGSGGGSVTSVGVGTGLLGAPNPITTAGSIMIAPGYQLPQGCQNGQVPASNGAGGWTCQPATNAGGTVTSITAGAGLTGGTITQSGTIGLAATQLLPTTACSTDQVVKWNGSAWECSTLGGGPAGNSPTTMYLKVESSPGVLVRGDSTDPNHVDEIVVLAYSAGRTNVPPVLGGGGGGGRVNIQDFGYTMHASRASPALSQFAARGQFLARATLTVRTAYPNAPTFPHQKIILTEVFVTSAQVGGSVGEQRPVENYSLNFGKVEEIYTTRNPDGSAGGETRSCWDIRQAAPC